MKERGKERIATMPDNSMRQILNDYANLLVFHASQKTLSLEIRNELDSKALSSILSQLAEVVSRHRKIKSMREAEEYLK